jgi:hypothetical protein
MWRHHVNRNPKPHPGYRYRFTKTRNAAIVGGVVVRQKDHPCITSRFCGAKLFPTFVMPLFLN